MEVQTETKTMLELMLCPAFCVGGQTVTYANAAAQALCIFPGDDLGPLLLTGAEEYEAFTGGSLYLQLTRGGACVTRLGTEDVFLLDPAVEQEGLQTMALAARELREPLNDLMATTSALLPQTLPENSEKTDDLLARMTRGLYQMQRILGNMSDAGESVCTRMETRNLRAVFSEIFAKAAHLLESAGVTLCWQELPENVLGLIDARQMERAVLNMLSNAVKFLPEKDGRIEARLTRRGDTLLLSITDNGSGIPESVLPGVFFRYRRQSGIEDSRFGLGLGMVLIRETAVRHGGTVLIHRPPEGGTQVCLTMKITASASAQVRCAAIDLTGGQDQSLVELSPCLPPEQYRRKK